MLIKILCDSLDFIGKNVPSNLDMDSNVMLEAAMLRLILILTSFSLEERFSRTARLQYQQRQGSYKDCMR